MNWIHVDEELPEVKEAYGYSGHKYTKSELLLTNLGVGIYCTPGEEGLEGDWYTLTEHAKYSCGDSKKVTYWMPMPQVPDEIVNSEG